MVTRQPKEVGQLLPGRFAEAPASPHAVSAILSPIAVVVLAGLIPSALVAGQVSPTAYPGWPIAFGISVYAGLRLALLIVSGKQRIYGFAYFLYVYIFLGLAPLVQLSRGVFPTVAPGIHTNDDGTAFGIVICGLLAFDLGSILGRIRKSALGPSATLELSVQSIETREIRLSVTRVYFLTVVAIAASLALIAIVGPSAFLQARNDAFASISNSFSNSSTSALLRGFVVGSLLVAFGGLTSIARFDNDARRSKARATSLAVIVGVLSLYITNVVNAPRYLALVVLIGMLSALGLFATRIRTRVAFVSALVGFLYVFPLLSGFRTSTVLTQVVSRVPQTLLGGDYDSFAQIVNSVVYVSNIGFAYGRQLLGALLVWVPRSIWDTKPVSTSTLVSDSMGYSFTNVSAPLWEEFYVDFGWLGVIIGFMVLGVLLRRLDDGTVQRYSSSAFPGIASMVMPFYLIILLRGALLTSLPIALVMIICIAFVRTRSPRDPSSSRLTLEQAPASASRLNRRTN